MKKMMMTMLCCLIALAASAQEPKGNNFKEKVFDAKVRELVYRLHITDEQKAKFVPIYRQYNDEMAATWGKPQKSEKPTNSTEAAALQKQKMERLQRVQAVRMKYIDQFATVLNVQQVNRFYEVEGKIQKKLMDRKKTPKGNHAKGNKHPLRKPNNNHPLHKAKKD